MKTKISTIGHITVTLAVVALSILPIPDMNIGPSSTAHAAAQKLVRITNDNARTDEARDLVIHSIEYCATNSQDGCGTVETILDLNNETFSITQTHKGKKVLKITTQASDKSSVVFDYSGSKTQEYRFKNDKQTWSSNGRTYVAPAVAALAASAMEATSPTLPRGDLGECSTYSTVGGLAGCAIGGVAGAYLGGPAGAYAGCKEGAFLGSMGVLMLCLWI